MKMNRKITVTLLLALVLALVFPTAALAFPVNTVESINSEAESDYFYKYSFDDLAVGTEFSKFTGSNPYDLGFASSHTGVIRAHDGDKNGNYAEISFYDPEDPKMSGFRHTVFYFTNGDDYYALGNTISAEFDIRWKGVYDTSMINEKQTINLLNLRCLTSAHNFQFLSAKIVAGENGGAAVPDMYLSIYAVDGTEVARLQKGDTDFTNIRTVYYNATQTYSVFVNGTPVIEAKACKNGSNADLDLIGTHTSYTYDYDGIVTSRDIEEAHRPYLVFARVDYSATLQTPYIIDLDNLTVKEGEAANGRTAYYENSFEGEHGNLVDGTYGGAYVYGYSGQTKITTATETPADKADNTYLSLTSQAFFNVRDSYQILQNGDWTVEFDARITSTADTNVLLRMYDGVGFTSLLGVKADGTIVFGGTRNVLSTKMATADSGEWTHVTVSVNVDKNGANKGKFDDWTSNKGSTGLQYQISAWIDGVYAGSTPLTRNEMLFEKNSADGRFINDMAYTRSALDTEPTGLSGFKCVTNTATLKQYIDEATGTYYYLQYDANGAFIPGALGSSTTASGSVKLTPTTASHGDYLGFFDPKATYSAGAIDNIKIYEGVYPSENAVGKKDVAGTVAEMDFGNVIIPNTNSLMASQSSTGGDSGVIYFNSWRGSNTVLKTEGTNNYVLTAPGANTYYDVYTPNVGGKVFSSSLTFRKFNRNSQLTAGTASLLALKRMESVTGTEQTVNMLTLEAQADKSVYMYFTKNGANYYLCDVNGTNYSANSSTWMTVEAIVDETGDTPLVSFRVNGDAAYFVSSDFAYPIMAANIEGLIPDTFSAAKSAIDQRVRFLELGAAFSVELDTFKTELIENPFPAWEDEAIIDFSDYESIDDLSPQFYRTSGVTIEDGVLKIPAGETFAWIDMNGTFNNFFATNTTIDHGFNIEIKAKTSTTEKWLVNTVYSGGSSNIVNLTAVDGTKRILTSGSKASTLKINSLDDGKFTNITTTFTNQDNRPTYLIDGALIGQIISSTGTAVTGKEFVSIGFASGTEISELYIHANIKSKLAERSGDLITLDPDTVAPNISSAAPTNGVKMGLLTESNIKTPTEGEKYYSLGFETANATTSHTEIPLTGQLEDHVSVFETRMKFIPSEAATDGTPNVGIFEIVRYDANNIALSESLLEVTAQGKLSTPYGILCGKDGSDLTLSSTELQAVAVIYDADAGQISYRIGGDIPYFKDGDDVILAEGIQLNTPRYYRMDATKTLIKAFCFPVNALGTLELEYLKIYTVNESANVEFVGTQVSTSARDIRIIAGLDMLYYGSAGFNVKAYDANGNLLSSTSKNYSTSVVYSSITETVNKETSPVYPENYGHRYFLVANITGITAEKAVKLEVTPYTATNGSVYNSPTVTLNVDFTKEDMTKWTCTTDYASVKPEGNNVTANFSTTEYVSYTNDGALELNGLNAAFAFGASCESQVSVNLTNAFGEAAEASLFDVYVDGGLTKENVSLAFGHHTLVLADGLKAGDHTFKLVKKSGGDFVRINSMNFCGEITTAPLLVRENAIDVVVSEPTSGNPYGNITVYLQTSEESGDHYIAYYFNYDTTAPNTDWTFDSQPTEDGQSVNPGFNKSMYRISGAKLVEKLGDSYTYKDKYLVLDPREITLAVQENGAADYVGGWHGDENMTAVDFYLDGIEIDPTVAGYYTGTQFEMRQDSVLNRCNTLDVNVMNHNVKCLLNTNGLKLEQQIEFLTGDFKPKPTYSFLQMATFMRVNTSLSSSVRDNAENLLCRQTNLLDANGKANLSYDCVEDPDAYWIGLEYSDTNRYAEYIGNNEGDYIGIYGLIGFVIDDASVKAESCRLQRRSLDNKWYPSFDTYNGDTVPKGEIWNVSNSYFIDYNPELYKAN